MDVVVFLHMKTCAHLKVCGFVDYGIFLLEHQGRNQPFVWLGILIGALSTAMSFGLLALSKTPALHTFGLTLLVGLAFVCVLTPCIRLTKQE